MFNRTSSASYPSPSILEMGSVFSAASRVVGLLSEVDVLPSERQYTDFANKVNPQLLRIKASNNSTELVFPGFTPVECCSMSVSDLSDIANLASRGS